MKLTDAEIERTYHRIMEDISRTLPDQLRQITFGNMKGIELRFAYNLNVVDVHDGHFAAQREPFYAWMVAARPYLLETVEGQLARGVLNGERVEPLLDRLLEKGHQPDGDELVTPEWIVSEFDNLLEVTHDSDIVLRRHPTTGRSRKIGHLGIDFKDQVLIRIVTHEHLVARTRRQFRSLVDLATNQHDASH